MISSFIVIILSDIYMTCISKLYVLQYIYCLLLVPPSVAKVDVCLSYIASKTVLNITTEVST